MTSTPSNSVRPKPTSYISDSGDDKNDGSVASDGDLLIETAKKVRGGRNDFSWHFGPRAWKRIRKELADKKKKE